MLNNFLRLYDIIELVITSSKAKVFKDKENIKLKEEDLILLKSYKEIFEIFIKATTKLQGKEYPTLYHSLPLINQIFKELYFIKDNINVSKKPYDLNILNINFNRTLKLI